MAVDNYARKIATVALNKSKGTARSTKSNKSKKEDS